MHLTKPITTLFFTLLFMLCATAGHALVQSSKLPLETKIEAFRSENADKSAGNNSPLILTITLNMDDDWYTYGNNPGDTGKPTTLKGTTSDGQNLRVLYPVGKRKADAFDPSVMINAYKNGSRLFITLPAGASLPVSMQLELLLCHPTKCIPARIDLSFGQDGVDISTLPYAEQQPWWPEFISLIRKYNPTDKRQAPTTETEQAIIQWDFTPQYLQPGLEVSGLLSAILMGLLAGLILNIMPCVLPVVSLKLSALLNTGNSDNHLDRQSAFKEHNIFFSLGIITFFLVLALILGSTGQAWGALFQNRWLVLSVAGLIMALSLSLFGLFHLPVVDLKFGTGHTNPKTQAFFTGMLTTLLATPCSGPFLGGVLGWTLVQGGTVIAIVFISIGIGMAMPYLLMVLNPSLARFLPKSGPWIAYVEKSIAFFLVGTAFYLVTIAIGGESLRILAPLWAILFGGWLWMQTRETTKSQNKWIIRATAVTLLIASVAWTTPNGVEVDPWEPFNPVELSQRIGKEHLFVEFTADWCPTCKVLESTVLTDENVTKWKKQYGVTFIKVDMTERDPEAEALLQALGSMSIPTAALFNLGPDSKSPMVLRDLYTQSQLENILESWKK